LFVWGITRHGYQGMKNSSIIHTIHQYKWNVRNHDIQKSLVQFPEFLLFVVIQLQSGTILFLRQKGTKFIPLSYTHVRHPHPQIKPRTNTSFWAIGLDICDSHSHSSTRCQEDAKKIYSSFFPSRLSFNTLCVP